MIVLRAAVFQLAFYGWTLLIALGYLPALLGPRRWVAGGMRLWASGVVVLLRHLARIKIEVRGRQHMPAGAAIVAAKHQSAFDTFVFQYLLPDPSMVMKRELLWIPIYGWHARKVGSIVVDRKAAASALRRMVAEARAQAALARPIVIFPQGTRTAPGVAAPYQPGVAALYAQLALPVVPVATNSGLFWPRRRFTKLPGTIVVEFLPAIPAGLPRREFMTRLETAIETASDRLLAPPRDAKRQLAD